MKLRGLWCKNQLPQTHNVYVRHVPHTYMLEGMVKFQFAPVFCDAEEWHQSFTNDTQLPRVQLLCKCQIEDSVDISVRNIMLAFNTVCIPYS